MVFYANRGGSHHPYIDFEKLSHLGSRQACCRSKLAVRMAVVASAATKLQRQGQGHRVSHVVEMCKSFTISLLGDNT